MTGQWDEAVAGEEQRGQRLDKYVSALSEDCSRSRVQTLLEEGHITVNGQPEKANYRIRPGDVVRWCIPEPDMLSAEPEPMDLEIVYEDEYLAIVNKPRGMVVHPAAGHAGGTLVNGLMHHFQGNLSAINGVLRPGIVHRIDKDTSGLLVVCKTDRAHQKMSELLAQHAITRRYHAIAYFNFREDEGTVSAPIGRSDQDRKKMAVTPKGRRAVTHYQVLERFGELTYVQAELETGRTHQIRVHLKSIGHPLLGDPVYGPASIPPQAARLLHGVPRAHLDGQVLHAKVLGFVHPITGQYLEFDQGLPAYFLEILEVLRKNTENL